MEMNALEPRRLFASPVYSYDLAVVGVSDLAAFTRPGGELGLFALYDNLGEYAFDGTTKFYFTLSADNHFGNADDIGIGSADGPDHVGHPQYPLGDDFTANIPSTLPPGNYFLAVTLVRLTGGGPTDATDPDLANNTYVTPGAAVIVTNALWPNSTIHGGAGDDKIAICENEDEVFISLNGDVRRVPAGGSQVFIDSGAGNDRIAVTDPDIRSPLLITGSGGNDTIVCGFADDSVSGGNGKDRIFSGGGDDDVLGGAGNDYIDGGFGDDLLRGAGGNDKLVDVYGSDYLLGGAGNDTFVARDEGTLLPYVNHDPDSLSGGSGKDYAQVDDGDGRASIEFILP